MIGGEKLTYTTPIADAHCHLNPIKGVGIEFLAKKFKNFGGWYLGVIALSPSYMEFELSLKGYEKAFQVLIDSCRKLSQVGLKYSLHLGFHPAEVDKLMNLGLKAEQVLELGFKVIDLVCLMIKRGVAHGIGEVGVQHYKTSKERIMIAEGIMKYSLMRARDLEVPIHLHLDQSMTTIMRVKRIATKVGCDFKRIVIHHVALELLEKTLELGFSTTIVGKSSNLITACRKGLVTLVESDYLDDPRRPGAVMVPWSLCRNWNKLLNKGLCDEEFVYKVNVEEIEKLYRVCP